MVQVAGAVPAYPVIPRKEPMTIEEFTRIVLQDGRKWLPDNTIGFFYRQGWDAHACANMCMEVGYPVPQEARTPKQQKKYEKILYQEEYVRVQIALAIYKTCGRLLGKNLVPSAKQIVVETKDEMEKILLARPID